MTLLDHLPVLVVLLPLFAAPLCVLIDRARPAWLLSLIASFLSLAAAITLLMQVSRSGTIRYELGGWAAPWGIEYRIDLLGAYVLLIVSAIAPLVMVLSLIHI